MKSRIACSLCTLLLFPGSLWATHPAHSASLQIAFVADDGRSYPIYDTGQPRSGTTYRTYLEATYGDNYAIRVTNNSHRRLGLVIAVDGRNIISGQKSNLAPSERMYILDPWQSATYNGWRTSNKRINQFFFTDAEDSYAGAWQDHSAMGVIALAVFNEKMLYRPYAKKSAPRMSGRHDMPAEMESSVDRAEASDVYKEKNKQAGTGFGDEKYSYARVVKFNPHRVAMEKYFYKYEWRETLCQQGIIDCFPRSPNRFWPEHEQGFGYAPYPPGR